MNEDSVKKNCLYGPKRENANTAIEDFLVKDHVFANDGIKEKKTWETTSHACFGKKNVKLDKDIASRRTEIQRTSNFEFGSDPRTHPLTTTTSFEFCKNVLPPVKHACHNYYSTNIPDFSHSQMQGKTIGNDGSIYASSYHMTGRKGDSRRLRDMQKKQTDDMRSTHFNLGSNKQRICSETLHSYHSRYMQNSDCIESCALKKTAPSSVFRSGDWNMSEPCVDTTSSVSQDDFGPHQKIPSFPSRNAGSTKKNNFSQHTNKGFIAHSTNFKLGSDKCLISSLYQKDFQLKKSHQLKPLKTARPKSSKFLQQTPGMVCPKSTEESDFIYKHDKALDFLMNRMHEFERNQDRHKVSCVALSDEQELMKPPKQVSMTFKDYQKPSTELLRSHTLQRRPAPKYDYILLDKGLVEPQYETTQKDREHQAHLSKLLDTNSSTSKECGERSRDDHQTHFAFGSDFLSTVQSEQHDQFTLKNPLDPCYPAAGSNRMPVLRNTHIYARDEDSVDESLRKSSVMKADYQPSTKQRVSTAQRRLLALSLKYPLVIAPSHYFHIKHDHGRTLPTTTTDYIPPEFMTGQA